MSVLDPADDGSASSSHMMRMTKKGRPFLKDTLDLFATLIISLELKTNKQYFRVYHNSFTTDQCCSNLSSLKFSQSNRGPDPKNLSRVITTTTTTTFSMTRDMAKSMAQNFLDAGLIENAADRQSNTFKDRGIYNITPKGLHILERFINKNGVSGESLRNVFLTQPVCMRLLHLERKADDDIVMSEHLITAVFRRFAGRLPNCFQSSTEDPLDPAREYHLRSDGVRLSEYHERQSQMIGRSQVQVHQHCFGAVEALEWLIDFTSITGRDEAAELAAQFMRYRWIDLVSDKRKNNDQAIIFTVRGKTKNGALEEADYRCTPKAIYRITEEGARIARWKENQAMASPSGSGPVNRISSESSENVHETQTANDREIQRRISIAERLRGDYLAGDNQVSAVATTRHSNTDRLRHILAEPALRNLFRSFLRDSRCEENLCFYLDVLDFKRRFQTTSSANAVSTSPSRSSGSTSSSVSTRPGQAAMQKHHRDLISMTFVIYNTYLAGNATCELNIDYTLRSELLHYLTDVLRNTTGKELNGKVDPEDAETLNATQLQAMIKLYERIQKNVFTLMATDSVPKFITTPRFLALRNWVEEYDALEQDLPSITSRSPPPGLTMSEVTTTVTASVATAENKDSTCSNPSDSIGSTYTTTSPKANEKFREMLRSQHLVQQMEDAEISCPDFGGAAPIGSEPGSAFVAGAELVKLSEGRRIVNND